MSVVPLDVFVLRSQAASDNPEAAQAALDEAEGLIAEALRRRSLGVADYTHRVDVFDGQVFPPVTPVVEVPAGWEIVNTATVAAPGLFGHDMLIEETRPRSGLLAYKAGWTEATLPATLRRAVIKVGDAILAECSPNELAAMATIAKSVSSGDQSMSFRDPDDLDVLAPGVLRRIRGWRAGR